MVMFARHTGIKPRAKVTENANLEKKKKIQNISPASTALGVTEYIALRARQDDEVQKENKKKSERMCGP